VVFDKNRNDDKVIVFSGIFDGLTKLQMIKENGDSE
jgi:hypothetical protein